MQVAFKKVCESVPKPETVLSVRVNGCTMAGIMRPGDDLDTEIWAMLKRFNYDPYTFRGWKQVPSARDVVAVVVS